MPPCLERMGTRHPIAASFSQKTASVALLVVLGLLGSLPLVILTPPFQVPDEVQHFYRAFQLSDFHLLALVQEDAAGGTLPDSLPLLVKSSVHTSDGIVYPATPAPLAKTLRLATIPLDPSARRFVAFPGSAFYSPLPYLPAALGIGAARALGLGPLALLYAGRLCNCLAALALLGLAVYAMPAGEEFLAVAGLLPMALYLYASLSADAVLIGCALLFSALAFRASTHCQWKRWELWAAAAAGAVFCSVKPVYAPLLLAGMMPGLLERKNAGRIVRDHAIVVAAAMGVTLGWALVAHSTMTQPLSGAHPQAQLVLVLHHPAALAHAIASALSWKQLFLRYVEAVGVFGWLTVPLWIGFYLLPLVNLAALWNTGVADRSRQSAALAAWYLALAAVSGLLVIVALYLMWAHVGQADVTGVQGRYFIPLLGLAALAAIQLAPARQMPTPWWKGLAITAAIVVAQIVVTDSTIVHKFHLFPGLLLPM